MNTRTFYVYVNIRGNTAKVLKNHYSPGVNEVVIKLVVEYPESQGINTITLKVPSPVAIGGAEVVESGINYALAQGWLAPSGSVDGEGRIALELTAIGLRWLYSAQPDWNEWWAVLRSYGLDSTNVSFPAWWWGMASNEKISFLEEKAQDELGR